MLNEPRSAMAKLKTVEGLFRGRHFDRDVVILCVRWYLRFKLSLRDLVEMMAERGLTMAHTTIMCWVQHYTPEFEKRWHGPRSEGLHHNRSAEPAHLAAPDQVAAPGQAPCRSPSPSGLPH